MLAGFDFQGCSLSTNLTRDSQRSGKAVVPFGCSGNWTCSCSSRMVAASVDFVTQLLILVGEVALVVEFDRHVLFVSKILQAGDDVPMWRRHLR